MGNFRELGRSPSATSASESASDAARLAEWEFHNAVLAVQEVARGQFGSDSNEAQSVELKKKSDRNRPTRQTAIAESWQFHLPALNTCSAVSFKSGKVEETSG